MARARRSLRTGELALADGDANAACSHAYYAMYYAGRGMLLALGEGEAAMSKTHSGLIAAFNRHFVRTGKIAGEHGRNFGHEANRRLLADYEGEALQSDAALEALDHARAFLAAANEWLEGAFRIGGGG